MTTVGFIGLGIMGGPMAANLVKAGFDVVGYNRSRAALDRLKQAGGRAASSTAEAAKDSSVIITMLPDSPDVERVALGTDGILAAAHRGSTYIDMSTVSPATSRALAKAGAERGIQVLDAPVSGGQQGAVEASLSIMVGGDQATFDAAMPVLTALGKTVVHVGPAGAGQTVKAANQLIVAGTIELVAEAIVLVEACGVDPQAAVRVLSAGLAGNRILDRKSGGMLARRFDPGFRVDLHHKDLGITLAAARDVGVAIPLGAMTAQLLGSLRALGYGSLDHSALIKVVELLSGRPDGAARTTT
jgi:2-hydroxy-3-oxopropionate reductase